MASFAPLDLSVHFNEWLDDREERGWLATGPLHTLRSVPKGRHTWAGVPFQIGPQAGDGPDCIVLADDDEASRYPEAAWQIPFGERTDALALCHTLSQPRSFCEHIYDRRRVNPTHIGRYAIHYADGGRTEIELQWEVNIAHWNHRFGSAHGSTAYMGKTSGGALIRLEYFVWRNPRPHVPIRSIDLISGNGRVRPVLLAITGIRYAR